MVAKLGAAHLALAIAAAGYALAWVYVRIGVVWVENVNVLGWTGLLGFAGGMFCYVVLRVWSRRTLHWLLQVQLLLATLVCVAGALAMMSRLEEARESLLSPEFWLTYNQTYRMNRYWVLRPLRATAAGIAWFAAVLLIPRLKRPFSLHHPGTTAAAPAAAPSTPAGSRAE